MYEVDHLERLHVRLENQEPTYRFNKVFKDPEKLETLIGFLKEGYSYASIGRHFGVDHTSIIWQAKKLGLKHGQQGVNMAPPPGLHPPTRVPRARDVLEKQKAKIVVVDGERVNRGLPTYQDYIKAENDRRKREGVILITNSPPHEDGE